MMRSFPIDQSRLEMRFVECVPKTGPDGVQKLHYSDSRPLWAVRCLCREAGTDRRPELVEVSVPNLSSLAGVLTDFELVSFDELAAMPWNISEGGRASNGIAFSASGAKTVKVRNGSKPTDTAPLAAGATST